MCHVDPIEQEFLNLLNAYRAEHGAPALQFDATLQASSEWMVRDMAEHEYVGHTDSTGRRGLERKRDFGYTGLGTGENAAGGTFFGTAIKMLRGFQQSPNHDMAQLVSTFKAVGVAYVYDPDSRYRHYWLIGFGTHVVKPYSESSCDSGRG